MTDFESWGRYPKTVQTAHWMEWTSDDLPLRHQGTFLPHGLGRSYGDSCLNEGGTLLVTRRLNRFIDFDSETGMLSCEAGVSLSDILDHFVPRGWFLPVSPGTKHVTVGGAIANDIHGKNHHRAGTFGRYVKHFTLLRSDDKRTICSADENKELFRATIGGLGLTGLILTAQVQLKPISGPWIDQQTVKFRGLSEFLALTDSSDKDYEYTVAWLDCVSGGRNFARGIFFRGNHSGKTDSASPQKTKLAVPFDVPGFVLNHWTIRTFNELYYQRQRSPIRNSTVHYDPFFYPLDTVANWNWIYGKRGFMQFQCIIPRKDSAALISLLEQVVKSGKASFLAVLKEFGDVQSPGMLSFPRPGLTLTLDFPNDGPKTMALLADLEKIVVDAHGALYPAKDATMSPRSFRQFYPAVDEFMNYIDPQFSSSFWRRVMGGKK